MATAALYFPGTEPRLTALLDGFLASLRDNLKLQPFNGDVRALLLAGGYGRGEGGIFRDAKNSGALLYNDLEFYLILDDRAGAEPVERWCAGRAHAGEETLGIEVEFKILRETAFLNAEPSMFYYDLLAAHRVVAGPEDFAARVPSRLLDPALIPAREATRLLFNRGTGLFYSLVALADADARATNGFVERNHAKARLALADAVLALNGRYHFSCRERHNRLGARPPLTPPDWDTIVEWHAAGVEFKLHPRHRNPPVADLQKTQAELAGVWMRTFLWLESIRVGVTFSDAASYATHGGRLFPETNPLKNIAIHARDRIKRGAALPGWIDYPRAALQRALVLLLQPEPAFDRAARFIGAEKIAAPRTIQNAYERWWKFYN